MTKNDVGHRERARDLFFEKQVYHPKWIEKLTGSNENHVIQILLSLGFKQDIDFKTQHPIARRYVLDFAFVNEQIALEVDGANHNGAKNKEADEKRDAYLRRNNWVSIRIKDKNFKDTYKMAFYKNLILEIFKERRRQWEEGKLYPIDFDKYDYE